MLSLPEGCKWRSEERGIRFVQPKRRNAIRGSKHHFFDADNYGSTNTTAPPALGSEFLAFAACGPNVVNFVFAEKCAHQHNAASSGRSSSGICAVKQSKMFCMLHLNSVHCLLL